MSETSQQRGTAAGVPYLAFEAEQASASTPLIVVLHLMDPPRSEAAMAAAVPLRGIDARRAYLGLPMFGERTPAGGFDEIMRLVMEDGLMNMLSPVIEQAAAELPPAIEALRRQLDAPDAPLVLMGGSAGGAAVLLALIESGARVDAAVLLNPATRAATIVESDEVQSGQPYEWTEPRRQAAARIDFVERAPELIAGRPELPLLFVVGAGEEIAGLLDVTKSLHAAIAAPRSDAGTVSLVEVQGLGHALAEEPGVEPAPQTAKAAEVDRIVTGWLREQLGL